MRLQWVIAIESPSFPGIFDWKCREKVELTLIHDDFLLKKRWKTLKKRRLFCKWRQLVRVYDKPIAITNEDSSIENEDSSMIFTRTWRFFSWKMIIFKTRKNDDFQNKWWFSKKWRFSHRYCEFQYGLQPCSEFAIANAETTENCPGKRWFLLKNGRLFCNLRYFAGFMGGLLPAMLVSKDEEWFF